MEARNFSEIETDSRYRTLLDVSTTLALQPDVHAVLRSVSALLSRLVPFESIALLLMKGTDRAQVYALEDQQRLRLKIGTEVPIKDTAAAQVLEKQEPLLVNTRQEFRKIPQLAATTCFDGVEKSYIFPVSSARKKLGVLVFGVTDQKDCCDADIELMGWIAAHLAVALENALSLEAAEAYRQSLERERDRLRLLLEINNHIITHLDVSELLRAASASIRDFFKNAFAGFWLFEESSNRLEHIIFDFPGSRGFIEKLPPAELTEADLANIRTRVPAVYGRKDIKSWPEFIAQPLRTEAIVSLASVPLMGSLHPLGVIFLGSRQENAFSQPDLDLLGQVGTQISLALDNALAYGRLNLSRNRLEDERLYLQSEIQAEYNFEDIIGGSAALRKVLQQLSIVAPTDSTVLLIGETGTGKELIARAIHNLSTRQKRTFVRLNCAAIPSGLMESELFGHERGAFTGALAQKRGRVELAHEGTLFLDEVGDINLELQPKLLRVLQEREFERLGSNQTIKVNVRLIAATHRDLTTMVRKGEFREDLYYRLNVFPIYVPPLRDRREDIPLLVHYFVSLQARKMRKSIRIIPRETMEAMTNWSWPGNVRELQNFVERSVILSRDETLAAPIAELRALTTAVPSRPDSTLHAVERETILQALRSSHGRISGAEGAAMKLGLKRTTLQRKMERLAIAKAEYI